MSSHSSEPLVDLGFTALEAEIYTQLLEESAATGYRLAQLLGKAAPNVYKALESLEAKGAVMVDDGKRRLCRAVPPNELLAGLDRRFREARERARRTLEERIHHRADHRVYQLASPDAVLERARTMLAAANEVVLVDAFPRAVTVLAEELVATAARGIATALMVYAPVELPGVEVLANHEGPRTLERWPGDWLNLVIDGRECLISYLDFTHDRVHQAIWTRSPFLSWPYHSALSSEAVLHHVEKRLAAGADLDELRRIFERMERFRGLKAAGYRELIEQFESPSQETSTQVITTQDDQGEP